MYFIVYGVYFTHSLLHIFMKSANNSGEHCSNNTEKNHHITEAGQERRVPELGATKSGLVVSLFMYRN